MLRGIPGRRWYPPCQSRMVDPPGNTLEEGGRPRVAIREGASAAAAAAALEIALLLSAFASPSRLVSPNSASAINSLPALVKYFILFMGEVNASF